MLQIGTSKYPFLRGKKKQQKKFEGHYVDMYEKVVKKADFFCQKCHKIGRFFFTEITEFTESFLPPIR